MRNKKSINSLDILHMSKWFCCRSDLPLWTHGFLNRLPLSNVCNIISSILISVSGGGLSSFGVKSTNL